MISEMNIQTILFGVFSGICVLSSLAVILHKNPVNSAVFLVLAFFSLAGIYGLMNAVFIATMQVLVYAGAIMVLVVFVLMLLSLREETRQEIWDKPWKKAILSLTVLILLVLLITGIRQNHPDSTVAGSIYDFRQGDKVIATGNTAAVGASIFLDYLLPFELVSIVLLAAVIGAVVIAKKKRGSGGEE